MRPSVFIGSSSEGLPIANTLAKALRSHALVRVWNDAFRLGDTFIEALLRELKRTDFAVLVATRDDTLTSRGRSHSAPRDNVVFEAGLFIGAIGRSRAFVLYDASIDLRLPSDLSGVTCLTFDGSNRNLLHAVTPSANRIAAAMTAAPKHEVDFLRAYLAVIGPDTRVSDTYAQILDGHLASLLAEANRLSRDEDWGRLLALKQRLREYFEYSGRYDDGLTMGRAYLKALLELGQAEEALWTRVKHIGYMLILSGNYSEGRREIAAALEDSASITDEQSRLRIQFYAHRYLGVSYHRDPTRRDVVKAATNFRHAEKCIERR